MHAWHMCWVTPALMRSYRRIAFHQGASKVLAQLLAPKGLWGGGRVRNRVRVRVTVTIRVRVRVRCKDGISIVARTRFKAWFTRVELTMWYTHIWPCDHVVYPCMAM